MKPRPPVTAHERFQSERERFRGLTVEQAFAEIHRTNLWASNESVSGLGSELDATAKLRTAIPELLREIGARSLLDIPCGDFAWMSRVELPVDEYIGADIVPELVEANRANHARPGRTFAHLNLITADLPRVDVVLCRDCLVHLSFKHVLEAIANLKRSGSTCLLTTTFPDHEANEDIEDGDWRLLNLQLAPFHFPDPEKLIVEGCTEAGGGYEDKSLGLWRIADL